jgi:hypothetical protein
MGIRSLDKSLEALDAKVGALRVQWPAVQRWRADAAAALFHLRPGKETRIVVCILGGTGTGKSTLVNRILDANLSAASFKRTFTSGAVAIARLAGDVPEGWLGLPHLTAPATDLPVRGKSDELLIVEAKQEILNRIVLVDTPDLDGDQPVHHAQAERAFRWAQAAVFLVSPEKYQMTELLPYYRLAKRYALPAIFVMNKCETPEMLEDYRQLISGDHPNPPLFAVARDDATYEPPAESNLGALRNTISQIKLPDESARESGAGVRVSDLLGRLRDHITSPLRGQRRDVDAVVAALRAMEAPAPGVDVNPITEQLQRRLQQRSVLYLIGPGRVLDRLRQVPGMLVRLPRTAWELFMHGKTDWKAALGPDAESALREVPDFNAVLSDQFKIIQSRVDDCVRAVPSGEKWIGDPASGYAESKIDPALAGQIADQELNELKDWLQKRWNATPRDTAILLKLLKYLPGGEKLTQWTEAAPYLLAIIVAAHHAVFGHVDLMILGGYSLATWLTERLSNEVAAHTRRANRTIAARFERLAHDQLRRSIAWVESQAPRLAELDAIEKMADEMQESMHE